MTIDIAEINKIELNENDFVIFRFDPKKVTTSVINNFMDCLSKRFIGKCMFYIGEVEITKITKKAK